MFSKEKFVIVVGQVESQIGVLTINTEQVKTIELGVCDTCIDSVHHPFLEYASWVSAAGLNASGGLIYLAPNLFTLNSKKGEIHQVARARILQGVRECPVIKAKTLAIILSRLDPPKLPF